MISTRRGRVRSYQKTPKPMCTNIARRKVNTTTPHTLSPPLNKHPPCSPTVRPPNIHPTSSHNPQLSTMSLPFLPPISLPIITPPPSPPSSDTPNHHTPYHHNHPNAAIPSWTSQPPPLPQSVGTFTLDRYARDTDPDEHLKVYATHVALYTFEDVIFCKAFPTTLRGPTLEWFTSLPPYSIDCFDTLSYLFTTHFVGNHPHQVTLISLINVKQEKYEMLRIFINRFSKAVLRMPNLTQEMMLQCMALTLKPGLFADNVYLRPLTSMHELKLCVADYIHMEEMKTLHTRFCTDYTSSTTKTNKPPSRSDSMHREPKPPRFSR